MTVQEQISYLASWRHAHLCAQFAFRGPGRPPDHSWRDCPKMARFHWAAAAEPSAEGAQADAQTT